MIETKSFHSEAHFSPKSETEFENETERDCGIALCPPSQTAVVGLVYAQSQVHQRSRSRSPSTFLNMCAACCSLKQQICIILRIR